MTVGEAIEQLKNIDDKSLIIRDWVLDEIKIINIMPESDKMDSYVIIK